MKKIMILSLILALILVFSGCGSDTVSTAFAPSQSISGSGTEADPYCISTAKQLQQMASWISNRETYKTYRDAHFLITADIQMSGSWKPIGSYEAPFCGVLDGGGHTVSGLNVTGSRYDHVALIAALNNGAVRNLTISDSRFSPKECSYTAAFVGYAYGVTLENCHTTDSVTIAGNNYTAGICANIDGESILKDCSNAAAVSASGISCQAAGIASYCDVSIVNCSNSGTISADADAAGIAGRANGGISDCTNTGSVTAGKGYAAGIICKMDDGALNSRENNASIAIENCINSGPITSKEEMAGGIATSCRTGILRNCVNSGDITAVQESGGIFAYFQPSSFGTPAEIFTVSNCSNSGSVTVTAIASNDTVGGICGHIYGNDTSFLFENCTNTGKILTSGQKNVADNVGPAGGIIGTCNANILKLISCSNSGSVTGVHDAGGLIGTMAVNDANNREGTLFWAENCTNSGDIYAVNAGGLTIELYVGGLIGSSGTYKSPEKGWVSFESETFINCANTGTLSGDNNGSGLRIHDVCGSIMSSLK